MANLTSFTYKPTSTRGVSPFVDLSGSWNYNLSDVRSFSFNPSDKESATLLTRPVQGTNPNLLPQALSFFGKTGQSFDSVYGVTGRGVATITLAPEVKAEFAKSGKEADTVATTLKVIGCARGLTACLKAIAPTLTSGGSSTALTWASRVALIISAVLLFSSGLPTLAAMGFLALSMTAALATYIADFDKKIVAYPPDPNYKVVAEYSGSSLPVDTGLNHLFDTYMSDLATSAEKSIEARQNFLSSMERYQGAFLADDQTYAALQFDAMNKFANDIHEFDRMLGTELGNATGFLESLGVPDLLFDSGQFETVRNEIITNGSSDLADFLATIDTSQIPNDASLYSELKGASAVLNPERTVPEPNMTWLLIISFAALGLVTCRIKENGAIA